MKCKAETIELGFLETIPSLPLGFLSGVFLANHLAITDILFNQNNVKIENIETQANDTQKWPL